MIYYNTHKDKTFRKCIHLLNSNYQNYRRTLLIVCAYFEKFDIAYFKKSMAYLTVRKSLIESSKFLLSITKFLLLLFQKKNFLFQAKMC